MPINLQDSWKEILEDQFSLPYFQKLKQRILIDKEHGKIIFPPGPQIFRSLNETQFNRVKVIILGQDPYHGVGQANGLCFSVSKGVPLPPSLKNIYKEIESDLKNSMDYQQGDLGEWAKQGVLLLNSVLTVVKDMPASHAGIGWEIFTDTIIDRLANSGEKKVFILWGKYAQQKSHLITDQHLIIQSAHPSPFSAHRGFFGSNPFSRTNNFLIEQGKMPVRWENKKPTQ